MDHSIPKEAVWEAMLYAAAPYAGNKELEEYYAADPNVVMPEKARRRMSLRIRRERKYREAHEEYRPVLQAVSRIVLAMLVVLAGTMLVFLSSERVRAAMWETVLEWGEDSILVSFEGGDMADVPTEILEYREPQGIGEEFEKKVVIKNPYKLCIRYFSQDRVIQYEQKILTKNNVYISNEKTIGTKIIVGNYEGILNEFSIDSTEYISITYSYGEYIYVVSTDLIIYDELIAIVKSIQ